MIFYLGVRLDHNIGLFFSESNVQLQESCNYYTSDYLMVTLTPSSGKTKVKENQRRALELCSDMNHAIGSPLKLVFPVIENILVCHITCDCDNLAVLALKNGIDAGSFREV